jgi:uncharacterized metal-binding protein
MPDGKTHDKITVIGATVAAPVWWYFAQTPVDYTLGVAFVGATLFSGMMLSPDLDLNSSIYHRWGPFKYLWWPYQKIIPHRSRLSHSFFLAPILRVVYFLFIMWALFRIVTWGLTFAFVIKRNELSLQIWDGMFQWAETHLAHTEWIVTGIVLGAALHVGADICWSAFKRRRRRRRR